MAMKPGHWYVLSKSKPEWNGGGHSDFVGGFEIPAEAKAHLEKKKVEFKTEPPEDTEWGYNKD